MLTAGIEALRFPLPIRPTQLRESTRRADRMRRRPYRLARTRAPGPRDLGRPAIRAEQLGPFRQSAHDGSGDQRPATLTSRITTRRWFSTGTRVELIGR
jgi:hypothetical protein